MGNSINQQLQANSINRNIVPPPRPIPDCTYGNVIITSRTPKSTSCLNGNDDGTGIATFTSSKYAKERRCVGKREIVLQPFEGVYNCASHYSFIPETVPQTNAIVETRSIFDPTDPTSFVGLGRDSGYDQYSDMININNGTDYTLPPSSIDLDPHSSLSLIDIVTSNDNIVSTSIEPFENEENNFINSKTYLQNKFNDFYHTYIYKCQGDEKQYNAAKEQLLQITNSSDYDRIKKIGQQLYTSELVANDGKNVVDCNSLKDYVYELSKYNLPGGITTVTNEKYTQDRKDIRDKYIKLNNERDKLDEKLRDLYNIPGYSSAESKLEYDSTIYAGVVITIIASSLVYYAFTKI
jgi:hypothetical protein